MTANPEALASGDRSFFSDVAQVVYTNPFGPARDQLDKSVAAATTARDRETNKERAIRAVVERADSLDRSGKASLKLYQTDDQRIIKYFLLFAMYHRLAASMDAHILEQSHAPDHILDFLPGKDAIEWMMKWGFDKNEALEYLGLAFQMKRAHFFIDRSLIGTSESMTRLRMRLWDNVFTHDLRLYEEILRNKMEDFSTLILGATGSGKGAAAAAIGRSSFIPFDDRKQTFIENFASSYTSINLSQYPESLIESELFGHKKGAFTGAIEAYDGVFSRCSENGALFLDEIGDVSIPVQTKLLRVLQDREFSPVGGHERKRFHGRVIAATNKDINALRRRGQFRDDFYYRLCSDIIQMPSLFQRIQEDPMELELMLSHTVARITGNESVALVNTIRETIQTTIPQGYSWPGNVRELEQCVRRIILTRDYQTGDTGLAQDRLSQLKTRITSGDYQALELLGDYCCLLYERHGTYEEVARRTGLDRRTAKKYIRGTAAN